MRSTFVSNGLRSRDKVEVSEFFTSGWDGNLLNLLIISLFEEDFCSIRGATGLFSVGKFYTPGDADGYGNRA